MSTSAEKDSERSSRQRGSSECKPLIDAATKDLFRKNAFRITGLSVDATTREIAKHADKIKMLAELEQDPHTQGAAFPMKPPPSLNEIREAIQKLKDPEKRLIDEFFWFWPGEFGNGQSDPAMLALAKGDSKTAIEIWAARENDEASGIVAKHNLALVYHVCALDWENYSVKNEVEAERRQKIADYWKGTFNRWERLATDERFWEKVTARIRQLNEPNLPTGFARRMRATLPEALDKINAELAVAFAESGKIELARLHIRFMRETNQGLKNVEKTAELVLTPARNRLKEQIQRASQSAQQNPATAHEAARTLTDHARPLLEVFDLFFGEQEHFQKELFDEVATTAVNCLVPPSAAPSAPTHTPPPTFGDGNSDGKVYRVPSSVSSTLASEKAEIESERTTLEALGTQIEKLGSEIERDRIYLDRTSQYAVDAFNSKVERYNALNQKAKIANAAFNEKVENYNAKLQRYGR